MPMSSFALPQLRVAGKSRSVPATWRRGHSLQAAGGPPLSLRHQPRLAAGYGQRDRSPALPRARESRSPSWRTALLGASGPSQNSVSSAGICGSGSSGCNLPRDPDRPHSGAPRTGRRGEILRALPHRLDSRRRAAQGRLSAVIGAPSAKPNHSYSDNSLLRPPRHSASA